MKFGEGGDVGVNLNLGGARGKNGGEYDQKYIVWNSQRNNENSRCATLLLPPSRLLFVHFYCRQVQLI